MKESFEQFWSKFAAIFTRLLQVIGVLLALIAVSDWPFYALNAHPFFDFGWGGLLLLVLAYILADMKSLAEAIREHYIGRWEAQYQSSQAQIAGLKITLKVTEEQNEQLLHRVEELEAQLKRQTAQTALHRLKPSQQAFEEEL